MFAVVGIAGKQYKVVPSQQLVVGKLQEEVGKTVTLTDVKLFSDGKKTKIGRPTVEGAKVTAKVLTQGKGEKIDVRRFKAKVRERRHIGFRPQITTIEIVSISA